MLKKSTIAFYLLIAWIPAQAQADCRSAYLDARNLIQADLYGGANGSRALQEVVREYQLVSGLTTAVAAGFIIDKGLEDDQGRDAAAAAGAAAALAISSEIYLSTQRNRLENYQQAVAIIDQAYLENGLDLEIFTSELNRSSKSLADVTLEEVAYLIRDGNELDSFCKDRERPVSVGEIKSMIKRALR